MYLHSVLALDPGGNVSSPSQRTSESAKDVVPFDPASVGNGTRFLLQDARLEARVSTGTQEENGEQSKSGGGHLGHDGSENRGRRVFTFPVGIFGHAQSNGFLGGEGVSRSGRGESLGGDNKKSAEEEVVLEHGVCESILC